MVKELNWVWKKYIEENISFIEENKWDEFYEGAYMMITMSPVGELTDTLYECGINPLEYMSIIPTSCFRKSKIKVINIPDGIQLIKSRAFVDAENLESIVIPETCIKIESDAFRNCTNLKSITILGENTKCSPGALYFDHAVNPHLYINEKNEQVRGLAYALDFEYTLI